MPLLRNQQFVADPRLDRMVSERTDHLEKYPLTASTMPRESRPVLAAVNWYSTGDDPQPVRIGGRTYQMIGKGSAGSLRGGHCVVFKPWSAVDVLGWWTYYDQGQEGRCVEFAKLRMMSLLNRKRYDISSHWHYWTDQQNDEWRGGSYPGAYPVYEGTSGRAGLDGLLKYGAVVAKPRGAAYTYEEAAMAVSPSEGIQAYRWARDWADVREVLGVPSWMPGVPMLNSWGRAYPHITIVEDSFGARLLAEDGEMGVVTDR